MKVYAHTFSFYAASLVLMLAFGASAIPVEAQISVTAATPNSASIGTVNLSVTINGKGFKSGAHAQWFVTGTTNPGGVTVNSTNFVNATTLTANITVADTADIASFDIQVTNADGRTGKGTELFAVTNNGSKAISCVSPLPLNPVVNACTSSTAQTGCVDATFGSNGLAYTPLPHVANAFSQIYAVRQQSDGKLVAIGVIAPSSVAVARYTPDGVLDTTFGNGQGYVQHSFGTTTAVYDGVIDNVGNILATGFGGTGLYVIRFTSSGVLDTSFASGGIFSYASSVRGGSATGDALAIQADGKILMAGAVSGLGGVVFRLNPNGTLDGTFGSKGIFSTPTSFFTMGIQNVGGVSRIIAAGQNGTSFGIVGITPSGTLDTTFASGGLAVTNFCGTNANLRGLALDAAGNIYASGGTTVTGKSTGIIALVKYTSYGAIDTTFGDPSPSGSGRLGYTLLDFYANSSVSSGRTTSLLATSDSSGATKLLLSLTSGSASGSVFGLARYSADGTIDSTFGGTGALALTWGPDDIAEGLAVQNTGEIVEVGSTGSGGNDNFTLFRVWP